MHARQLTVEVRDKTLKRIGQVRPTDLNLTAKLRWCGVGEWTLTLPGNHPMVPALETAGSGLLVTARDSFGQILDTVFSGPTIRPQRKRDVKNPEGTLTFYGVTDEVLLDDAQAFPSPLVADPAAQTAANDIRTGLAEALLRQYVAYNIANGANMPVPVSYAPAGRLRGFRNYIKLQDVDDGKGTVTMTKAPRYQNLLELCQEIATTDGTVGFRMVQVAGQKIEFQVTSVVDRRKQIRLDIRNGTLVGEETLQQGPTVTDAIVLGQGEGVHRQVERRFQPTWETAWNRPIERVFEQGQTSEVAVLQAKGDEELAKGIGGLAAKVIPADSTTMQYLKDWKQGDWITVVVDGVERDSVVTEAVLIFNDKQSGVGVSVGDVSTFDPADASTKNQQTIDSRVAYLERMAGGAYALTGEMRMWAGATAPAGWMLAQGQSLLRADYPALFAVIGTTYGAVDASHFTLPDLRGRVPVGRDAAQTEFDTLGETGGSKTHSHTISSVIATAWAMIAWGAAGRVRLRRDNSGTTWDANVMSTNATAVPITTDTEADGDLSVRVYGSTDAGSTLQPYQVVNYIIKT